MCGIPDVHPDIIAVYMFLSLYFSSQLYWSLLMRRTCICSLVSESCLCNDYVVEGVSHDVLLNAVAWNSTESIDA